MQNKLLAFIRENSLLKPGDKVVCAVSGGADSMALLWAMHLLQDKLGISLEAAHFNHRLRGEESQRDEAFVKDFCHAHGIVCHVGSALVEAGEKGLEAAAREARYRYFASLSCIIATAHTADDNAETMLMHLIRGTGLKGLGGIAPVRENIIRPMLTVTRQEVLAFLETQGISYVTDSTNNTDEFLRNRIRHHVMPLLRQENPSISENLSTTALRLRQDDKTLDDLAEPTTHVAALRQMEPAVQSRALGKLLVSFGVKEPEGSHIELLRKVILSDNPSACADFPGDICIGRIYGKLVRLEETEEMPEVTVNCPGVTDIPQWGLRVHCTPVPEGEGWQVRVDGQLSLRSRRAGDTMVLSGGTRSLKKLFIDRKIPASRRSRIPVLADRQGVVAVGGIGPGRDRIQDPNYTIYIESIENQPVAEE